MHGEPEPAAVELLIYMALVSKFGRDAAELLLGRREWKRLELRKPTGSF